MTDTTTNPQPHERVKKLMESLADRRPCARCAELEAEVSRLREALKKIADGKIPGVGRQGTFGALAQDVAFYALTPHAETE